MNLLQQFKLQIVDYLTDRKSLRALYGWLGGHIQDLEDAEDPQVTELNDLVWCLISEWLDEYRDEASVRAELTKALRPRGPIVLGDPRQAHQIEVGASPATTYRVQEVRVPLRAGSVWPADHSARLPASTHLAFVSPTPTGSGRRTPPVILAVHRG